MRARLGHGIAGAPGILCVLISGLLISVVMKVAGATPADQDNAISKWKTFGNRAGWTVRYPGNWQVGSCRQCADPADPAVFITFSDTSTKGMIMIEPLSDKPPEKTAKQWLADVKVATNLNPQVSEEWIVLDGAQGLKVINRNPDSTESETSMSFTA